MAKKQKPFIVKPPRTVCLRRCGFYLGISATKMITIQLLPKRSRANYPFAHQVADQTLLTDTRLTELAPFDSMVAQTATPRVQWSSRSDDHFFKLDKASRLQHDFHHAVLAFRGDGWLFGKFREVECWSTEIGYLLVVEGAGRFVVAANGQSIVRQQVASVASEVSTPLLVETVLGPALTLALALQGTWSLHASAVAVGRHAIAFVGDSGAGKSTLARFLATSSLCPPSVPPNSRGGLRGAYC